MAWRYEPAERRRAKGHGAQGDVGKAHRGNPALPGIADPARVWMFDGAGLPGRQAEPLPVPAYGLAHHAGLDPFLGGYLLQGQPVFGPHEPSLVVVEVSREPGP